MTHKGRIFADRAIAVPLAFLFNGLARLLGWLLRRDHSVSPENVNVIIVGKLIGMGSILQSTPLLRALKQRYPGAKLIFVSLKSNRDLLDRLQDIDEVLLLDDSSLMRMAASTLRSIMTMVRARADVYLDLEVYSAFASLLALCAITRNRVGFYRHSTSFKKGIYTHLVYFNPRMSIRKLYLQLGRVSGIDSGQSEITGPIRIDATDRVSLPAILSKMPGWHPEKSYVVVNPNASDLLLERRWPTERVTAAISELIRSGNQVVLIGAPSERPFVRGIYELLPTEVRSSVTNTVGLLSFGELLALLDEAACVLTNDTGPMHISIALERPTVCLFGPASPKHYGQELPHVEIFYSEVFCSPCCHEADEPPCNGNNICMQRIDPQLVVQAVNRFVRPGCMCAKKTSGWQERDDFPVLSDAPDGTPLGVVVRASLR
jgi:heptosyltransferase-2